jgi:hypothetical protein
MKDNEDLSFPILLHLKMKKLTLVDELDDDDEYEENSQRKKRKN